LTEVSKKFIGPMTRPKDNNVAPPKQAFMSFITNYQEIFCNKFSTIEFFSSDKIEDFSFGGKFFIF
jgi:hypothetical protein